jgi:alpha-beta hydrolase superfamily lysophospholipase
VVILIAAMLVLSAFVIQPVKSEVRTVQTDAYVFKDQSFSFQFLRTLSAMSYGGADFGECLETAKRIKEGDFESWTNEWTSTAERIKAMGDAEVASYHNASAAECYLRAANYFRAAEFYLHGNVSDPRIHTLSAEARELFVLSLQLSKENFEKVNITYQNTTLPGFFFPLDDSGLPRATLIMMNGFDGTQEELYLYVQDAHKRGYSVLTFEGPGQGEVVREQNLYFRPDWEKVITPVIDYLENRTDVDGSRIALWGISMGGYLAPRAAAFDHRLAAVICDGGVFDPVGGTAMEFMKTNNITMAKNEFLGWMWMNRQNATMIFESMMDKSTNMRWLLEHGMYVFGKNNPVDYYFALSEMSMIGIVQNVTCPTLVCDGTNDTSFPGQAVMLYNNLTCTKTYHLFDMTDGAGYHCQIGAFLQGNEVKLDWLETTMPA